MTPSLIDYSSPSAQFAFDVNKSQLFKKDQNNYINIVGREQLNTLKNLSLLDIFLQKNNIIEPHYHQNASELIYCVTGAVTVSIFHPFTKKLLKYNITPGKVVNVPQGWWHYIVCRVDSTHLLAIFDAPTPEVVLGSDLLTVTPANIMAQTYCLNEAHWKLVIQPVQPGTFIGPANDCRKENGMQPFYQYAPYQVFSSYPVYSY